MSPQMCLCILVYLYLQIICASCDEGRSLAFVIEDSLSMSSDISTVRAEAKSFVNLIFFTNQNKIKNLVLIAFNKGVRSLAKTESINVFIQSINYLSPNNRRNLDCPVKSLAGIEKALESSGPESFIYVFTDANAKDYTDLSNVTALCQEKQSQVVIIRTKALDCYNPNEIGNKVYYDVAKSCSGQVFDIEKHEIKSVMKTFKYLLQNKNTVFKWVTTPRSNKYVSVKFTLSDKDTYALISASGTNVELRITTNNDFSGQQPYSIKLFWTKNNKVSYLMRKGPGTFYAWVKGDSAVTVVVYGRSHFSFKHGFSVIEPKSITNTNKQPTAGLKHHLIIKVNDLVPLVNIKEAQILDIANNGKIINHLRLTNIGRDVYVTESFVSPNKTFGIAVKGESQTTGNEIIIMAKTNIDPLNNIGVTGMPTNRNITLNVAKGAKIELNCMIVRLSPNTNVVWFKKNANNFIRITHARSKILRINGALFLHAGQYKCQATDEKGTDTATFDVTVTGMPEISVDETKKNIPYDSDAELTCTVESNAPVNIIWKNEKGAILENPMVSLTVSKFYNRLHLRKVRESAVYTCLASNNIGHSRKDVSIVVDEGIPQIQASNRNVNVKKGAKAELDCKVTRGSPKTRVTWFKKRNNNFEQLANAKSEVLKISKAMFEHGGQYKCQASNGKGTASAIFDVTVHGLPEVIVGESTKNISYGSDVELMCVVKSNAPLTIIWKNERGTVLENKVSQITESEFHNRLNVKNMRNNAVYTCKASNNIGSSTKKVSIIVPLLFEVKKHIEGDLSINYGRQQTLQCHITSTKPMTIRWYRQEIGIKASRSLITTSKKYTISNDGSELIINNMDTSMTGEYTCEASLLSKPDEKISYSVNIKIVGLARPEIKPTNKILNVTKGSKIELDCKVIRGTPKPVINWYMKNGTSLVPLNIKTEVLTVNAAQLTDAGEYKCEATNELGTAAETFAVVVSTIPEISITETKIQVPYDGEIELTCNVRSYPSPKIEWKNKDSVVLQNQVSKVSEYTYYNKYKAQNLRKSAVYVCVASNDVGISNKSVDIIVLSPFEVKTHVQGVTEITYGTRRTLQCDIKSTKPMKILWYRQKVGANERSVISTSEKYTISDNGSELTINFMETNMAGKYTCEGSLLSNPSQKISYSVDVNIIGLGRPELQVVNKHVNVTKGGTIQLSCRIIRGTPQPVINWYKNNGTTLMPLNTKTEVLTVNAARLADAGEYKCEATNELGTAAETFDVVVSAAPEIFIDKIAKVVPYDSQVELTCKVESYVQPLIVWKNENGIILENKVTKTSAYLYSSQLKVQNIRKSTFYDCVASNNVGSITRVVNITVASPFEVIKHIQGDIGVAFGKKQILQCDIKSKKPITIRWYRQNNAVKTTRKLLIRPTNTLYSISGDGSMLTINSMATNMAGEYTCEASLLADPSEKISYNVKVNIVGLVRPEIQATNKNVYATKGNKVELNCRIIRGTPTPVINWYRKNGTNLMPLNTKTEVLTVNTAQLADAGEYKCEATNELGTAAETFGVTISTAPEISIVETTRKVPYDGEVELTCNVESYPPPRIEWKNKDSVVLQNQVSKVSDYTYYNKYRAQNLRKSAVYVCVASNDVGISNKSVDITVLSPFEVKTHVQGVTGITYGTRRTLQCDIKSTKPMRILWYRQKVGANERSMISTSEKYTISDNGSELTINFMETNMAGKYTCEGSLLSNPSQKISYSVDVNIIGLGRPELQSVNKHVNVTKGGTIQLRCRIIRGTPQPVINWYMKNGTTLMPLNTKTEVLTVNAAQLTDAGEYKCEATNELGTAAETFDVVVSAAPEIFIDEIAKVVPYDSQVELTCNVESYVQPLIVWKNENGIILENKVTKTSAYLYSSQLKVQNIRKSTFYDCVASNNVGSITRVVNITVASPFEVIKHVQGDIGVAFGKKQILQCDIKSKKPITIRWYRQTNAVKTTRKLLIRPTNILYSISGDGSMLTINSMATNMAGEYTCEASLLADPSEKISYNVKVNIVGLVRPEIQATNKNVYATKGNKVELNCRIIRGTPTPVINWYRKNGTNLMPLNTKTEVLTVNAAQLTDAGEYKCEATNELGTAAETFGVTISTAPEISIVETTRKVPYDGEVELTCNVESYPPPRIEWKNKDSVVLQNQVSKVSDYTYYNKYRAQNLRKSAVYACVASNDVGISNKSVDITVLSPFEVKTHVQGVTGITYGTRRTLQCDIKSTKPMRIVWYRQRVRANERSVISSSEKYTISDNGSELTINFMETNMAGKYTCEGSLLSNPSQKISYSVDVNIIGLGRPELQAVNKHVNVTKGGTIQLSCRIIRGTPQPVINWYKKNGTSLMRLNTKTEVLTVNAAQLTDAGEYKCEATNELGIAAETFDVVVSAAPEIFIDEIAKVVPYDSQVELTCNVESYVQPLVVWKNENGIILENKVTKTSAYLYSSQLKVQNIRKSTFYDCEASNNVGSISRVVNITVASPFEVIKHIQGDIGVAFGKKQILQCDIKSKKPITIRWYRQTNAVKTTRKILIRPTNILYSISGDGSMLTINSMATNMAGEYTCETSLLADPSEKISYNVKVNIVGLVRPEIQATNKNVYATKGNKVELNCRIIRGTPTPVINWYRKNGTNLMPLNTKTEVLTVNAAQLTDAGEYKCEATNELGTAAETFGVTISTAPEISIVETTRNVPYDGEVELTCNVESYPPPRIEWKNEDSVVLQNQVSKVSEYTYYNKYKAQNLRKSAVYVCVASNDVGISNKSVDITVLSPFEVKTHVQGVTEITYGTRRTLQCDIKSTKPMRILWYRQKVGANEKSVISSSEKYSVSDNGSELTINFMKTNMAGKYTCEGSLLSNPSQKISYSVDVNIIGLGRPELQVVNKHVNLTKGGTIQLSCRIIRGTPRPVINWYKKNGTSLMRLNTKTEELTVNAAQLTDAGEYKCEATNELGTAAETFDVIVRAAPEISLAETTKIVPYDSEVELTCNVDSYVTPMIVWKNEKGLILETKFTKTSEYVYSSRLKVSNIKKSTLLDCVASNNVGSTSKDVNITVASPFEVKNHVQGIVRVEYGRKQILQCDIKSVKPITIRWYRLNNAVKTTTKSLIRSSNKYSISDDGSVLTINSMATNMAGEYTCEASLLTDPTEKISYSVNVNILGLERPKIQTTNKTVQATKGNKIQLNCRIIRGTPKPVIKWYKNNGTDLILFDTKAEVFTVNIAQITDSGEYKCEASNELGTAAETFNVVVSAAPIISLEKTRRVPYDSEVELTCNVESYPSPRIEWKNIDGVVLQDQVSRASKYYYYNRYKITNVRKNVVYTCVASNNVGSTSKYVEINVLSPFEVKTYIRGVTKITYGDKHTLQCDIKSTKPMRIRWYRQEIGVKTGRLVISSSAKYTVSNDGTELTINSMDTKMSGLYTCEASLLTIPTEKVTYSTQVDVAGLASPHGFFSSEESTNSYKAICRYQGVPTPIISWQFKPKGSEKFKDLAITGEQLDITPLKSDNSGIYKCIATNIAGETEHEFAVTVQERPKILTEGTTHYGVEGDLVLKIPCNVTGVPEPTVVWKIDNKPINIGTKFVVKGTNLYINKPVRYDSAEYKCEATNKLGNDIKSFSVEIADSFENNEFLTGDTHEIYAEMDKPKAIQCNLTNKGESSVRWYMNGMLTKQVGSIYRIERVSSIDSKNYTCRVNTDEGSKSETFALEAGYPPSFEDNTPSPVNVNWTNTRQKMDCAAVALPNPKYEWRLNGKLLESSTNLKEKEITYWGEYTCEVSNALGKINKKFIVTSAGCYINKHIVTQIQPLAYKKDIQTMDSKNIENNEIVLAKDKEIKLLCPSSPKTENAFKIIPNKKEIVVKCIKQDEFIVDKKRYKYSELQCNTKIEPSVIHTREQCAGTNSELLRVGYEINGFLDAYRVCYDVTQRTPLYANVPASISKGYDKLDTKQFEWTPLSALNNTDTENENTEGNCECCYIKNQLVKASDLPFNTDQSETSVDNLNSIRVWNPNGCDDDNDRLSWEKFDEISRQIAAEKKWPYWTGASEYVDKDGKKVPRYLWRVFKTMKGLSVSIYVNDYTNLASDSDVQCVNKCDSITPTDQFLYCCSPDEFSRNFGVPLDRFK